MCEAGFSSTPEGCKPCPCVFCLICSSRSCIGCSNTGTLLICVLCGVYHVLWPRGTEQLLAGSVSSLLVAPTQPVHLVLLISSLIGLAQSLVKHARLAPPPTALPELPTAVCGRHVAVERRERGRATAQGVHCVILGIGRIALAFMLSASNAHRACSCQLTFEFIGMDTS